MTRIKNSPGVFFLLACLTVPHTLLILLMFGMPRIFWFLQQVLNGSAPESYKAVPRAAALAFYLGAFSWAAWTAWRRRRALATDADLWRALAIFAGAFAVNVPFLDRAR